MVEDVPLPPAWQSGISGTERVVNVGDDSGVLAILSGIVILLMLSYKHVRRLISLLVDGLWRLRTRANAFDDHTSNETRVLALMGLQWSVCTGILLYIFSSQGTQPPTGGAFVPCAMTIGMMAAYYLAQLCAYSVVGYTFASTDGRRHFVSGFTSSQSLLGFALIIPTMVAIFYPSATWAMLWIAAIFYIIARILFILKGFRIFYHKIQSLLYFILYLCTLEIIPVLILFNYARLITHPGLINLE